MNEHSNNSRILLSRIALRALHGTKRVIEAIWPTVARTAALLGRMVARVFILPVYRALMFAKLRSRRLTLPARGFFLILVTNRYLFHLIIVSITVATVGLNLAGRQANAQDAGQESILYAMVTDGEMRSTEQEVKPELLIRDSRYTGPSSLLAFPDIDFDYDENEPPPITALSVPGTLLAGVTPHEPGEPNAPAAPRMNIETYVVQPGDTLSTIARRFGVNVGTILWANSRTEFQFLRPGDALKIPPVSGVLIRVKKGDTIIALAAKYSSDVNEIIRVNRLVPDESLPLGLEIVMPGGRPPYVAPVAVHEPVPTRPGPRPPNADTTVSPLSKLLWPTSGRVITQYYGWRHTGVDIDGDYSSPIYASHDGRVVQAGWNKGGYGIQIVIQAPNGVMTRYAHASKLFVKVGDVVRKGETIAMVGTTGRSTGTHLHYEVYVDGKRANPLSYTR
ncbi:MAG TPA: M23 family metallopeptidase [Candidatus Methylomirabilis sp.]|nr:M23 family metallopeptidase [Candidatus Methylomirabilis sp.]